MKAKLIRPILKVRLIGSIVRRLYGPALRYLVVVETTELYLGRLRGSWRHRHPIPKTSRHQVLCHAFRPMLAFRGRRPRCSAAHARRLFPSAAWAAFLPHNRPVTPARRVL